MRIKIAISILLLPMCLFATAQLPYSNVQYPVRQELGIPYDSAFNYCNRLQVLKMNLYKPVGDFNPERPIIIFVHGGAFVSSSDENDGEMVAMAKQFASRGYVAASIHYREGIHLYNYAQGNPALTTAGFLASLAGLFDRTGIDRLFTADSAEVLRAGYRAQQDIKSAIRFLKARTVLDSSAACKFFIGGHSARAITVLITAFLDDEAEKPIVTASTTNVTNPLWVSNFLQPYGPGGQDDLAYRAQNPAPFNFNAASCYVRPDLGTIDGAGNMNSQNLKIIGVAAMAGATPDSNILAGPNKPALFLYHLPNDVIVPFINGRPFGIASDFISPSPNQRWPVVYGSNFIYNKLQQLNYPSAYKLQTYDNGGDQLTSHSILPGVPVVADSIAKFFARVLDTSTACPLIILPVATSFLATRQGEHSMLTWKVYNRGSLRSVDVQRSADGRNWFTLGTQQINTEGNFIFFDNNPLPLNYYRLKEKNADGNFTYSEIKILSFLRFANSRVFPNPARDYFLLEAVFDGTEKFVDVKLYTLQGQLIHSTKAINAGNVSRIETTGMASGIYICKLMHNSRIETIQITVAK